MKTLVASRIIKVPDGVEVSIKARRVVVKGPRGTLSRDFKHLKLELSMATKNRIKAELWWGDRKTLACLRTLTTHIQNMIVGVTKGFQYKMRLVYAHFPINISIDDEDGKTKVGIRNYLGEKAPRNVMLHDGVTIERSALVKDELVLSGNDVNSVSQSAANIHIAARVATKDIRKFLDGAYVSERGHIVPDD